MMNNFQFQKGFNAKLYGTSGDDRDAKARQAINTLHDNYGIQTLFHHNTISANGRDYKAIGHVATMHAKGIDVAEFIANTKNQSLAVFYALPMLSLISMSINNADEIESLAHNNLLVYHKKQAGGIKTPTLLPIAEINRQTLAEHDVQNLDKTEYINTMTAIAIKNARKRMVEINEYGVLNGKYRDESYDIEKLIEAAKGLDSYGKIMSGRG
ncbi:MAG: hypothetical protein LBK50_02145 [Candidatus Nomurabacteria bacterium]|jgi:hypothetical protein|nr:hypothetical protein [Candidatus Nomurabacteria bacterium]